MEMEKKSNIDLAEIGLRIKEIRTTLLKKSQTEFADILDTKQELISRLEQGKGGSLNLYLDIVNLLNSQDYKAHLLFAPYFSIESFKVGHTINTQRIVHLIKLHSKEQAAMMEDIVAMLENSSDE